MLGLNLSLSLSREAVMQSQRQRAARMGRDELAQLADELIQRAHKQEHLIMELQRKAANLMVELELKDAPVFGRVSDEHLAMARELRRRMP
jgi:hypothetical protein